MIERIDNNYRFKLNSPFNLERSETEQSSITEYWESLNSNSAFSNDNGFVYLVTSYQATNSGYLFNIGQTHYCDLVYARDTKKIIAHSLFVSSYIKTSDDYICVILDKNNRINTIGGLADSSDFCGGSFLPEKCLHREVNEELGINLLDQELFRYRTKYVKLPSSDEANISLFPIGLIYEIRTKLTSIELKNWYSNNYSQTDGEVKSLLFVNRDNYKSLPKVNIVRYIPELLDHIFDRSSDTGY